MVLAARKSKKKSGKSPKARSMELMRSEGYMVADVEKRLPIPGLFITRDLFGFGDILASGNGENVIVQTTSAANISTRINKIDESEAAQRWLFISNNRIEVHGWAKRKIRGQKKVYWECVRKNIR